MIGMETTVIDQQTQQAEIEAIKQVIATLEHSQQNELPEEFVGLFRADAIWTTGHGKYLTGRDEISSFTHQVLPGAMKDSTATYEVVDVLFIRPDVAAVKAQRSTGRWKGSQSGTRAPPLRDGQGRRAMAPGRLPEH